MELGIAVIGAGILGSRHARVYSEMPCTRLVAVVDIDGEKARRVAEQHGAEIWATNYETVLNRADIEAVSVATPDFAHADPVVFALGAGKHVLVEKPLATSVADGERMLEAQRDTGKILMVNYSHRFAPEYFKAKLAIEEGSIGDPLSGYARKNDTIYVPTQMLNWSRSSTCADFLSSHDIDLVRWYMESEAVEVYATGVSRVLEAKGISTPDAITAIVRFENGAFFTFESAWVYPNTFPTICDSFMELIGSKGVIHLERKREAIEIANEEGYKYPRVSVSPLICGNVRGAFRYSLEHFVESATMKRRPLITGEDGMAVTRILDAIHRSLEAGLPVAVH